MIIKTTLRAFRTLKLYNLFQFTEHKAERYFEKPWKRQAWLSLNKKCTIKDAIHGAWLMSSGVMPFSYDGYEWACARAIECQPELQKDDLLMLMSLGVDYGVRLSPFSELLQNEVFLRIHRDYEIDMQDYEQQVQQQIKSMYADLEAKSLDYFSLLKEEDEQNGIQQEEGEVEVQETQQKITSPLEKGPIQPQNSEQQTLIKLTQRLTSNPKKQFELKDLTRVADLLQRWNSKNITLIQYLQELLTVRLQSQQVEASLGLAYLRFLTFACQSLMAEYQQNKKLYTARSIKRIYKYQYFYYQEHFRHLIASDATSSPEFMEAVIKEYASFPIKRREIRKKIGIYVSSQFKRFGMSHRLDLIDILLDINRKDQKMKRTYRAFFGLPESEPLKEVQHKTSIESQIMEGQRKQKNEQLQK